MPKKKLELNKNNMEINNKKYHKIILKIGSSLIVENNKIRYEWIENLAKNISNILTNDCKIIIVTSGAVALGRLKLNLLDQKLTLPQKQSCASVGQIELMSIYKNIFNKHNFEVAQILLTANDCNLRKNFINCKNTCEELLKNNIIPIINENDSVAVDEIKIGDNDRLSARVAQMIKADLVILLSDIDGLYNKNPKLFADAKHIPTVNKITKDIEKMAKGTSSKVGTGGMITKIMASKMVMSSQSDCIITNGSKIDVLTNLIKGKQKFTIFTPIEKFAKISKHKSESKKNWLAGLVNAKGSVIINELAKEKLLSKKVSLLPVGVIFVNGNFNKNDTIFIFDENHQHIGSGVVNYNSQEVKQILQKNSSEVKKILGASAKKELIHIDNLFIL